MDDLKCEIDTIMNILNEIVENASNNVWLPVGTTFEGKSFVRLNIDIL